MLAKALQLALANALASLLSKAQGTLGPFAIKRSFGLLIAPVSLLVQGHHF